MKRLLHKVSTRGSSPYPAALRTATSTSLNAWKMATSVIAAQKEVMHFARQRLLKKLDRQRSAFTIGFEIGSRFKLSPPARKHVTTPLPAWVSA